MTRSGLTYAKELHKLIENSVKKECRDGTFFVLDASTHPHREGQWLPLQLTIEYASNKVICWKLEYKFPINRPFRLAAEWTGKVFKADKDYDGHIHYWAKDMLPKLAFKPKK